MKRITIEIKWAIIFSLMTLLWMMLEKLAGLHDEHIGKHAIVTNFVAIPAIAIYVFALLDKRKNYYNGKMTYLQGVISGLIISAIVTVLSPLNQYITSTYITPGYFQNAIDYAVETGKMSFSEANDNYNLKNYIVLGLISAPVLGLITTLIVAIFTKKR
ncbi:MAG: DUF4199 domain-containing protein [Bacteroidales bacterium]|nr:DUF4199 domain-containing protein [Bacteroidales bacterium]